VPKNFEKTGVLTVMAIILYKITLRKSNVCERMQYSSVIRHLVDGVIFLRGSAEIRNTVYLPKPSSHHTQYRVYHKSSRSANIVYSCVLHRSQKKNTYYFSVHH
jgi:hypothetical protein